MEVKKERLSSINQAQKTIITEFMESHPELKSGQFSNTFTHKNAQALWSELLSIVNSVPGGGRKETWQQIRKCWQDMKKNAKQKNALLNKYCAGTGGGGPPIGGLDKVEEKIMQLLPGVSVSGDPNVSESAVTFTFETSGFELVDDSSKAQGGGDANTNKTNENKSPNNMQETSVLREVTNVDSSASIGLVTPCASASTHSETQKTPKTRTSKSIRLAKSLAMSENMVAACREKLKIKQHYYQRKLELMEADSKRRELYERKKLELLSKQVDASEKIAERVLLPRFP